jgi:Fe-S-cluster containining protein
MARDGFRFTCQGSGKCCLAGEDYGYVYLTRLDRQRLAAHFEISQWAFTRRYAERTDGYFYLKEPDTDCRFLENKRCTVYEARPLQCRTWPFWPENINGAGWTKEAARRCPGIGKGRLYGSEEIQEILARQSESRGKR